MKESSRSEPWSGASFSRGNGQDPYLLNEDLNRRNTTRFECWPKRPLPAAPASRSKRFERSVGAPPRTPCRYQRSLAPHGYSRLALASSPRDDPRRPCGEIGTAPAPPWRTRVRGCRRGSGLRRHDGVHHVSNDSQHEHVVLEPERLVTLQFHEGTGRHATTPLPGRRGNG